MIVSSSLSSIGVGPKNSLKYASCYPISSSSEAVCLSWKPNLWSTHWEHWKYTISQSLPVAIHSLQELTIKIKLPKKWTLDTFSLLHISPYAHLSPLIECHISIHTYHPRFFACPVCLCCVLRMCNNKHVEYTKRICPCKIYKMFTANIDIYLK